MRKRHDSQPEVGVHLDLSYAFYRPDPFCNSLAFVVPRRDEIDLSDEPEIMGFVSRFVE